MQESILRKLEALVERHQEVEQLLSQADVIADQDKFRDFFSHFHIIWSERGW